MNGVLPDSLTLEMERSSTVRQNERNIASTLLFDSGVDLLAATARDRFEALARSVRDNRFRA
jgi:hypothetical protein